MSAAERSFLRPELWLHTQQMENNLVPFEEKAERNLLLMCKEREKLQKKAHELKRKLLLCRRKRELADILDAQVSGDWSPSHVSRRGGPGGEVGGTVDGTCHCRQALTLRPAFDTAGCQSVTASQRTGL